MQFDKFYSCKAQLIDRNDPRIDTWKRKWSSPCIWKSYDRIEMTEDELNNLFNQMDGMSYGGSDLILNPALPEFTLRAYTPEQGVGTRICFKKTILPTKGKMESIGNGVTQITTPLIDAYVYLNGEGDVADEVITLGRRVIFNGGQSISMSFSSAVWMSYANPMLQVYSGKNQELLEFERSIKLAYMSIQKALYDRPILFVQNTEHTKMIPETNAGRHKKKPKQHHKIKAVRVIRVDAFEMEKVIAEMHAVRRTMSCPCWGVIGHWRDYKSGKRVWISPYRKGKERNRPECYQAKEYEFMGGKD